MALVYGEHHVFRYTMMLMVVNLMPLASWTVNFALRLPN